MSKEKNLLDQKNSVNSHKRGLDEVSSDAEEKCVIRPRVPFSQPNKLVKMLASDARNDRALHKENKQASAGEGSTKETNLPNIEHQPGHLPPKHGDALDGTFPYINMFPDHPNPRPGVPICVYANKYSTAPEVTVTDKVIVHNPGNYRVALSNYGATTGTFYYEAKILDMPAGANLRIGVGQSNLDSQAPLGYDGFGYSFRANPPTIFHRSRPYDVKVGAKEGDVIGVLLHMPPLSEAEQREVGFRVWDKKYVYSQFSYEQNLNLPSILHPREVPCGKGGQYSASPLPSPPQPPYPYPDPHRKFNQLPLLSGSQLVFFVNGKQVGLPFSNLVLAKYYPAISLYQNAKVKFNFGPDFLFPPPSHWEPTEPLNPERSGFMPVTQEVFPFSSLVLPKSPTDEN